MRPKRSGLIAAVTRMTFFSLAEPLSFEWPSSSSHPCRGDSPAASVWLRSWEHFLSLNYVVKPATLHIKAITLSLQSDTNWVGSIPGGGKKSVAALTSLPGWEGRKKENNQISVSKLDCRCQQWARVSDVDANPSCVFHFNQSSLPSWEGIKAANVPE